MLASLVYFGLVRNRTSLSKFAALLVSAATLSAIGLVPNAVATSAPKPAAQAALAITNSPLTGVDGVAVTLTAAGGSGTGAVTFVTSGSTCSISGNQLTATGTSCSVKAVKAASTGYKSATSPSVKFTFTGGQQAPLYISNSSFSGLIGQYLTLTTTGGSGTGKVTFSTSSANCLLKNGTLKAADAQTCTVTATKAASKGYVAKTSPAVAFTFCTTACASGPTYAAPVTARLMTTYPLWGSSGVLNGPISDTANGDQWFIDSYYSPSDRWLYNYVDATSQVTLTWQVTAPNGAPLANQAVTLRTQFAPGGSDATFTAPGMAANGDVSGTTDANGIVSFTLTNTNTAINTNTATDPSDLSTNTGAEGIESSNANPWTRMALVVGTDTITSNPASPSVIQATDLVDLIVIPVVDAPSFATPDVATLTSVTGLASGTSQINDTVNGDSEFINQWYVPTDNWYQGYITAGSTVTQNWHVVGSNGQPLADTPVTLTANLQYGCSVTTSWNVSSLNVNPGCGAGPMGQLQGTTDANGNVSFTITNTDTATGSVPSDMTTGAGAESNEKAGYKWARFVLQVGNDSFTGAGTENQGTDLLDLIVIPAAGATTTTVATPSAPADSPTFAAPDTASLTAVSGIASAVLDNTVNGDNWFINSYYSPTDTWGLTYVDAGSTVSMTYHVNGSNGAPLANAAVSLVDNLDYSGSNGTSWSDAGLNANPGWSGAFLGGTLAGTTDAQGNVTFTFTNTNASTGSCPSDMTTADGANANLGAYPWTRTVLQVGNDVITTAPATGTNEATPLVDLIVVPAGCGAAASTGDAPTTANPDTATLVASSGLSHGPIDDTVNGDNWFIWQYFTPTDTWNEAYVDAGSTVSLTYHVTGSNGQALVGAPVTFNDNIPYSGAHGTMWQESGLNTNPAGSISGTTDANGNVTFTIHNTNPSVGSCPSDMTTNSGAENNEGSHPWTRTYVLVGNDTTTGGANNGATPLLDLIVVPSGC